jgi:hypothetical protein
MQQAHDYLLDSLRISPLQNAALMYEIKRNSGSVAEVEELADMIGVDQWAARQWARDTLGITDECGHVTLTPVYEQSEFGARWADGARFICTDCGAEVDS